MTICRKTGYQCVCQPQERMPCPYGYDPLREEPERWTSCGQHGSVFMRDDVCMYCYPESEEAKHGDNG